MPQKHVKHWILQATNTFLYLNNKKNNERLYTYVSSYFCKPKVLQSFLKGKNVYCWMLN